MHSSTQHTSIFVLKGQNHIHGIVETVGFDVSEDAIFYSAPDDGGVHQRQHGLEALASAVGNGPAVRTGAEWPASFRNVAVKPVAVGT